MVHIEDMQSSSSGSSRHQDSPPSAECDKKESESYVDPSLQLRELKRIISKHGGYSSCLELNQVLRLHHCAITRLTGHTTKYFPNLTTLYLNNNAITGGSMGNLSGLSSLPNLIHLYLADNCIAEIDGCFPIFTDNSLLNEAKADHKKNTNPSSVDQQETRTTFQKLETLDLSNNGLMTTRGFLISNPTPVPLFPRLRTLLLARNSLSSVSDLAHFSCLESLDLSDNRKLQPPDQQQPREDLDSKPLPLPCSLLYLRLSGSGVPGSLPQYRKRLMLAFPKLSFLDEMPVSDDERRLALAWESGGYSNERQVREQMREEKRTLQRRHSEAFEAMVQESRRKNCESGERDGGGYNKYMFVASSESDGDVERGEDIGATKTSDESDVSRGFQSNDSNNNCGIECTSENGSGDEEGFVIVSSPKQADRRITDTVEDANTAFSVDTGTREPEDSNLRQLVYEQAAHIAMKRVNLRSMSSLPSPNAQSQKILNSNAQSRHRALVRHRSVETSLADKSRPLIWKGGTCFVHEENAQGCIDSIEGSLSSRDEYKRLWALARDIPDNASERIATEKLDLSDVHLEKERDQLPGTEVDILDTDCIANPYDKNFTLTSVASSDVQVSDKAVDLDSDFWDGSETKMNSRTDGELYDID